MPDGSFCAPALLSPWRFKHGHVVLGQYGPSGGLSPNSSSRFCACSEFDIESAGKQTSHRCRLLGSLPGAFFTRCTVASSLWHNSQSISPQLRLLLNHAHRWRRASDVRYENTMESRSPAYVPGSHRFRAVSTPGSDARRPRVLKGRLNAPTSYVSSMRFHGQVRIFRRFH